MFQFNQFITYEKKIGFDRLLKYFGIQQYYDIFRPPAETKSVYTTAYTQARFMNFEYTCAAVLTQKWEPYLILNLGFRFSRE